MISFVSLFFFLTLLFSWNYSYCQDYAIPSPFRKADKIVIGCLLPLSGEYELLGKKALRGVLTAADLFYSETNFQVVVKDTGSDTKKIRKSLGEMVTEERVSFVIGPISSTSINEVSASAESLQVPTVVFPLSEHTSPDNRYTIKFSYSLEKQSDVLAVYAVQEIGVKTFGILHPRTPLGELFKEAFVKSIKRLGREVIYTGSYDSKLTDISTEFQWIKSIQPDALFIPDGASRSGELIMKLKRQVTLGNLLFLGPNTWNSEAFLKTVGREADGVLFTDFFFTGGPEWADFSNKYKIVFNNEQPGFLEYQVYEAVKLILNVLKIPIQRREEIMERLLAERNNQLFDIIQGTNGSLEISPKPLILTVKDGNILKVK